MTLTRTLGTSAVAAGIALAGLFSAGAAAAQPGGPCGAPNTPACQPAQGPGPAGDWQHRNIDQARNDHQPFQYQGQQVHPLRAGNGDGWGFWFLGQWIRL